MLGNFKVNNTKMKVAILHSCVHCSSLLTEINYSRTFLFLQDNLEDIKTQIFKILVRVRFRDANFKLREFESRLLFFQDLPFYTPIMHPGM